MRSVGAELFRADGRTAVQTDVTKKTVAFRNFVKASKNSTWFSRCFMCFVRIPRGEKANIAYATLTD
jgi:hypothetical protein